MKIYTKQGDKLKTSIIKKRVFKDHDILETLGTIDEVMSYMMIVRHSIKDLEIAQKLEIIAKQFFKFNQDILLSTKQISSDMTEQIEKWIDSYSLELPPLTDFILPGDSLQSSQMHFLRTLIRRLERRVVHIGKSHHLQEELFCYINRLSDFIYVLARYLDKK